jgi:DNA-binding MarR family transcriptional regulator
MNENKTAKLLANLTFHLVTSIQERHTRLANRLGLTEAEFRCLLSVGTDKGLNNTNVGKRMQLTPSRVTRLIEGLEDKGYLTKRYNRDDRRSLDLSLSRKGIMVIQKLDKQNIDMHSKILDEIKKSQRRTLIVTMENLNSVAKRRMRKSRLSTTH